MPTTLNHRVLLGQPPSGKLGVEHFTSVVAQVPARTADAALVRAIYAQVPPAARAVMTNTTPFPPTRSGDGIFTAIVGEVVDGPTDGPPPGTVVTGFAGWEEYSVVPVSSLRAVPAGGPLHRHLGALGHNGLAAYFGMLTVRPRAPRRSPVDHQQGPADGGIHHL
jgi:NADPH-dependent curcumin reductase CurA